MAQEVGYGENSVTFTEGPFVICNPLGNGWRIEAEIKKGLCPILPDISIYHLTQKHGWRGKTMDRVEAARLCDRLNQCVRGGQIVLDGRMWVAAEAQRSEARSAAT